MLPPAPSSDGEEDRQPRQSPQAVVPVASTEIRRANAMKGSAKAVPLRPRPLKNAASFAVKQKPRPVPLSGAQQPSNARDPQTVVSIKVSSPDTLQCNYCIQLQKCSAVITQNRIMRSCKELRDYNKLQSVFNQLISNGHRPSVESYTILMTGLLSQGLFEEAETALEEMALKGGVEPDTICFNAMINGYCEAGKMKEAITILQKMRAKGFEPSTSTFNTLIKGYGIAGQLREAMKLLYQMENDTKVKPNVRTYNSLINAWCRTNNLEKAWDTVTRMRLQGIPPDVVSYNTLAKTYVEQGDALKAESLIYEMQNSYLRPNEYTCSIVIKGLCSQGLPERGLELANRMIKDGVVPNIVVFNTLIQGQASKLQPAMVDKVLDMMEQHGVKPDVQSFSIIMNAWSTAGLIDEAKVTLHRMRQANVNPDVLTFSILAKGFVRAGRPEEAEALLQEMRAEGVAPNVVMFTTLISGWCSMARMDEALRVYNDMIRNRVKPNLKTFQTLIWGFSEAKRPDGAEEVLQLMKKVGIFPDLKTQEMIVDAWRNVGFPEEAERVSALLMHLQSQEQEAGWRSKNISIKSPPSSPFLMPPQSAFMSYAGHGSDAKAPPKAYFDIMASLSPTSKTLRASLDNHSKKPVLKSVSLSGMCYHFGPSLGVLSPTREKILATSCLSRNSVTASLICLWKGRIVTPCSATVKVKGSSRMNCVLPPSGLPSFQTSLVNVPWF